MVTLVAALGSLAIAGAGHGAQARPGTPAVAGPCQARVRHDVLPLWLRGGFTGPDPRVPYAVGSHGSVGAVVFGWPLHSPPLPNRNNKILWVPRRYPKTVAPFWIRLQLMQGDHAVGAPIRKIISTGPGPSIVDVPTAGCWRLTLSWSGRRDTLDLDYTAPG
ncbi:MAG: hypothetical protein QOD66_3688 [Solirubrobacteraceae bacterium]|nr:hypothetical protein [Solirubrobacteraceae bacterium]